MEFIGTLQKSGLIDMEFTGTLQKSGLILVG